MNALFDEVSATNKGSYTQLQWKRDRKSATISQQIISKTITVFHKRIYGEQNRPLANEDEIHKLE